MRIESLKTAQDRVGRFRVGMEDGSVLRLYRQTVEDFGLYPGKELPEEEYARLLKSAEEMSARMRAVRIISAANVSQKDLENRLVQKGESPEQAKAAVQWLAERNLVDDRAAAEQIVYSCINRGYGLSRAKQVLYQKKIPRQYWEEALADYPDQVEKIKDYLRNRLSDSPDPREIKKVTDALLRRGHSYRNIRQALEELTVDADEFLEEE